MPTAAKLISAISLAALAFLTSEIIKGLLPEGTRIGSFSTVNVLLGILCGWIIMGNRAGRGKAAGISNGLTAVVALVFWALVVQSGYEMVSLAMKHRFGGPLEAFAAIFEIGIEYAQFLAEPQVALTLITGAILSGLAAEYAAARWK